LTLNLGGTFWWLKIGLFLLDVALFGVGYFKLNSKRGTERTFRIVFLARAGTKNFPGPCVHALSPPWPRESIW
jgi:hypothetical protein